MNAVMVRNEGVTVPSKLMSSNKSLDPIVENLINLVEDIEIGISYGVMATTLRQQGITTFEHLCNFPYYDEFYGRFTYYKENDADVNTSSGNDIALPDSVVVSIHWLLLWCIHRHQDEDDPSSNNPSVWTHDEFIDFANNNNISRHDPQYVGYDEYTNNKTPSNATTKKKRKTETINSLPPELLLVQQQQTGDHRLVNFDTKNDNFPVPPPSIPRLEITDSDNFNEYQNNNNIIGKNKIKINNTLSRDNTVQDNINQVQSHDTNLLQSPDNLPSGTCRFSTMSAIQDLLGQEVSTIEQLLSNANAAQQLLDTISKPDHTTTEDSGEQTLLSVMISSMNQMTNATVHDDRKLPSVRDDGEIPSTTTDCLPLHTPIDGEFVERAVHLENRDQNRDLTKEMIDDNKKTIDNLVWITSINKPNHEKPNKDDDSNKTNHEEPNKDDGGNTEKDKTHGESPPSPSNHVLECSTTNIVAINSDETNKNEEWDMVAKEVTEQVRATLINEDEERSFNTIRGSLLDGGADVLTIGQTFNVKNTMWPSPETRSLRTNTSPNNKNQPTMKALIDGGANGGITGTEDSCMLDSSHDHGKVLVKRLGSGTFKNVPLEAMCAVSKSTTGNALCMYNHYANGQIQPTTVHSKIQLQHNNNTVDDTAMQLGGRQTIITKTGIIFPLTVINGLCHLEQRRPTASELETLPRVVMTSPEPWDPTIYDDDNHESTTPTTQPSATTTTLHLKDMPTLVQRVRKLEERLEEEEEDHERTHNLLEARQISHHEELQRMTTLAQFQQDETIRANVKREQDDARSVILLDKLDLLRPKDSATLGGFLLLFSNKLAEYDSIASSPLNSETKTLKLQRCVADDDRLMHSMFNLRIATRAAGSELPSYSKFMEVLTKTCIEHDSADSSKLSVQGAAIWQQLSPNDKDILSGTTSKRNANEEDGKGISRPDTVRRRTIEPKEITLRDDSYCVANKEYSDSNNPKSTRKCSRHYGIPTSELTNYLTIAMHKRMHPLDLNYTGSPYIFVIVWDNGQITDVPFGQVLHDSPDDCTKYVMKNDLELPVNNYDRLPKSTQLTHSLMTLAFRVKRGNVSLAIELYDALNFKLLLLDITDSDSFLAGIRNNTLNASLGAIQQRLFHHRTLHQMMVLIAQTKEIPMSTYTTPSEEVFTKNKLTDDDKELNDTTEENEVLRELLLVCALDMHKLFPVRWTNEVFVKFLAIGIETPTVLLQHIANNTLNTLLSRNGYLTMNQSTTKILADASPLFRTGRSHQYGYNQNG